jgi:hypothetical protein
LGSTVLLELRRSELAHLLNIEINRVERKHTHRIVWV